MEQMAPLQEIHHFQDFLTGLRTAGMTTGSENGEGVFSLCAFFGPEISWHTEDPETDPWEWRIRVLEECEDIAYGKLFFNKSGYLTQAWYSRFLAVRREAQSFDSRFGTDPIAKRIYELICDNGPLPLHMIKKLGFFSKEDHAKFERALVSLQASLYLTMCGRAQKRSKSGEEYGWSSTVFCLTEERFGTEPFREARKLDPDRAYRDISSHLLGLNPGANPKKIQKFILGR